MDLTKTELAKKVSKALRHDPDSLDLAMDDEGWVTFEDLLEGFERFSPYQVTDNEIKEALKEKNRGRFDIDTKEGQVRAKIGHTTNKVQYKVIEPDDDTYYRIEPERYYEGILEHGIKPSRKKYTQLFTFGKALKDGKRRGVKSSIMLTIKAKEAYHEGTLFYERDEKVFVEEVDPFYVEIEEV